MKTGYSSEAKIVFLGTFLCDKSDIVILLPFGTPVICHFEACPVMVHPFAPINRVSQ